jgi:hypothetical protein
MEELPSKIEGQVKDETRTGVENEGNDSKRSTLKRDALSVPGCFLRAIRL